MSAVNEIASREVTALSVVGTDVDDLRIVCSRVEKDYGKMSLCNNRVDGILKTVSQAGIEKDCAVNVPVAHQYRQIILRPDCAYHDEVSVVTQLSFNHADHGADVRIVKVANRSSVVLLVIQGDDNSYNMRGFDRQAPCRQVRNVIVLFYNGIYFFYGCGRNAAVLSIDDVGHGHHADAGFFCNIF